MAMRQRKPKVEPQAPTPLQRPLIAPTPADLETALSTLSSAQMSYQNAAREAAEASASKKACSEALGRAVASIVRIRTQLKLDEAAGGRHGGGVAAVAHREAELTRLRQERAEANTVAEQQRIDNLVNDLLAQAEEEAKTQALDEADAERDRKDEGLGDVPRTEPPAAAEGF